MANEDDIAGRGRVESDTVSVEPSVTYTRTGDDGASTLGDGSRAGKSDLRIVAYGEVEEASAAIGVAIAQGDGLQDPVLLVLSRVQNDLVDLEADLVTPRQEPAVGAVIRIDGGYVERLERACDHFNEDLPPLPSFVVSGGTGNAALLYQARSAARRAERATCAAQDRHGESMNPLLVGYLNRLSSLLFILARRSNAEHGDTVWRPGLSTGLGGAELWETQSTEEP
ncbi:MAG: cob(I)yrinic acid a,c-diamide adenosyltransferase [Pseudonocardia sp.]|nr:cob(I)yrinic acid a,c-diamide adenosyltransferase [Pseudonocardia sp.]